MGFFYRVFPVAQKQTEQYAVQQCKLLDRQREMEADVLAELKQLTPKWHNLIQVCEEDKWLSQSKSNSFRSTVESISLTPRPPQSKGDYLIPTPTVRETASKFQLWCQEFLKDIGQQFPVSKSKLPGLSLRPVQ